MDFWTGDRLNGWFKAMTFSSLKSDAWAGVTGAAIVLPQAVAFASIAGLPPEYGLYTAMIPAIIAALFGSSLVMISGPTTAISAVVFSSLAGVAEPGSQEFIQLAILLAFLVGVIQVALAAVRAGRLAGFVSHSVMIGFTSAAALLIAVSQIGPALGISPETAHGAVGRAIAVFHGLDDIDLAAMIVAGTTLATVVILRVVSPKWPGFLIAVFVGTVTAMMLGDRAADLRFVGSLPSVFPAFSIPSIGGIDLASLIESAFAIAIIGLLEAIAIGRSLSNKTKQDFSANQEVFGQGVSNVVGGLFQCYPSSGSFTRSGVNLEAGASSPMAAVFASLFLLTMGIAFSPFVALVPISAIAGLILYVAYRLPDYGEILHLIRTSTAETAIAAITFFVGIAANLETAIFLGTLCSLAVFLGKSASPALVIGAPTTTESGRKIRNAALFDLPECPSVVVLRLDGPLFFGSVDALNIKFRKYAAQRPSQSKMILILHGVGEVDLAGVELIELEVERRRAMGGDVFIVAHYPPMVKKLRTLGLMASVGEDHIFDNKGAAIAAAQAQVDPAICAECRTRIFIECPEAKA